jgi:eukaryotic-like serine/threonine-protein kinase
MTDFICPHCHRFTAPLASSFNFCPFCGAPLSQTVDTLAQRYELKESIGKGGMGEVFLAYDISCGRQIALKRIRSDLLEHPQIRHRFLKEAHITCQLTHPAIIPIYSIQADKLSAYYTMPFVEGETLKQLIRKTRQLEKKGDKKFHVEGSIPSLVRIFIIICQAVAYAHAKGVLHRDLKPENIIVGKYGEALILDWGLAKWIDAPASEETLILSTPETYARKSNITRTGRVVGTVAYMAPERALGQPATIQTDIYSLGVILYHLLTLKSPFKRGTLDEFRKSLVHEELVDPAIAAPYRDVPRILSRITAKCMSVDLNERYRSVDSLIHDLENYIEGRSEWFEVALLNIMHKEDWEFQENILIAEHTAITRVTEESEWVSLMISRQSFAGNTKIETSICLGKESHGIGILLSIPEAIDRTYVNDGYCLWLSSDTQRSTKLLRSNVEVLQAPDIFLKPEEWTLIRLEKIEETIHLYLNGVLQFSYIAHLPLIGTHIGLLSREMNFEITALKVFVGNLNLTVNCLAVPDAFLAYGDFTQAISEYRRIAYSFPDRAEGREALFRAGLTLIEQAKASQNNSEILNLALEEFEKLHETAGAPLEYLGKALVYQTLNEEEEEIKCFDLAYRRYPHHPLLPVLQEQIISRMHQVSRQQRSTTYHYILLTIRHLPIVDIDTHTRRLFTSLQKHWEPLPFLEEPSNKTHLNELSRFAVVLSFWLAKPYFLGEMIDDFLKQNTPSPIAISDTLYCLIQLGSWQYAAQKLNEALQHPQLDLKNHGTDLMVIIAAREQSLEIIFQQYFDHPFEYLSFSHLRTILDLMNQALDQQSPHLVHKGYDTLATHVLSFEDQLQLDCCAIWADLLEHQWQQANTRLDRYPLELFTQETSLLSFLYGCLLLATEGEEIAHLHFKGLFHVSYPRTWTLANRYIAGELSLTGSWFKQSFLWEKQQLYRQLHLYYYCANDFTQADYFKTLYNQQFIYVDI